MIILKDLPLILVIYGSAQRTWTIRKVLAKWRWKAAQKSSAHFICGLSSLPQLLFSVCVCWPQYTWAPPSVNKSLVYAYILKYMGVCKKRQFVFQRVLFSALPRNAVIINCIKVCNENKNASA